MNIVRPELLIIVTITLITIFVVFYFGNRRHQKSVNPPMPKNEKTINRN